MIDTHCHLESLDNIDEIINKMDIIITSGYDDKSNLKSLELIEKYPNVYATLGIHPDEVDKTYDLDIILKNINHPKVVGIGEIGLDYHCTKDNIDKQKALFRKQLDIAKAYHLPVVIHSRDAILDTYDILKEYNLKGSLHCFSSSADMALKFISLGYKIGVGGVVTFKNGKKLREVVECIDIKDILTETDSPYLSPEPLRGRENNPANIFYIIKEIASIKEKLPEEIEEIVMKNAKELFKLD